MGFPERLAKLRKERNLGIPQLADMINIHPSQLRRYEKGGSQPTLEVLKNLAVALNVPGDVLLFDEEERKPPESFVLQFEALSQLSPEDIRAIRSMIDGLLIRQQAKTLIEHQK